jgi:hypothetical protein
LRVNAAYPPEQQADAGSLFAELSTRTTPPDWLCMTTNGVNQHQEREPSRGLVMGNSAFASAAVIWIEDFNARNEGFDQR